MPGDMTVEQPRTGIVSFESDDYVASLWQKNDVATGRVYRFQCVIDLR